MLSHFEGTGAGPFHRIASQSILLCIGKESMTSLKKVSSIRAVVESSLTSRPPKTKIPDFLSPPIANQTLNKYLKTHSASKAITFFRELWRKNPSAVDSYSSLYALKACSRESLIVEGRQLHVIIKKMGFEPVIFLQTCLIELYSKMGDVECAHRIFDEVCCKNAICWTTLITAYLNNNLASKALTMFRWMLINKFEPDQVTMFRWMVEEGKQYFKSMKNDYGLWPRLPHLGCMVDLFCRAGLLEEAYDFLSRMLFQPNAMMWRMLLGACCIHGDIGLGEKVRQQLLKLDPTHAGDDVALSNMYAGKGLWYEKGMVRDRIECRRMPECSSVEVAREISEFVAGDSHHPLKAEIYDVLGHLTGIVKSYNHISEPSDINNY